MSLLRTLDRTSAVSNPANTQPILAFLYPCQFKKPSCRTFTQRAINRPPKLPSNAPEYMDNFFIQALARAGSCSRHAKPISTWGHDTNWVSNHKRRRREAFSHEPKRYKSTKERQFRPLKQLGKFAQRELKALVDYYGIDLDTPAPIDKFDTGPGVWNVGDDHQPWPIRSPEDAVWIEKLEDLLEDEMSSHDEIFEFYSLLPSPGVAYLRQETIRQLLHHLSIVDRPTPIAMQRFLSILDDMNNTHIHINRSEWTTAIHFAGRFMGKVSDDEVQSALHIWRDMERRAKVRSSNVTLNVLFDIAVKSGKYALADTFLKEMQARKFKLHRHFRVSIIYYYGVIQNGNGVRRTYHDLVEAGEVVDTVVMNAVIAALIRAGEPAAAEHVFERMKRLHATRKMPFPGNKPFNNRTWRQRRLLGLHLTHEARRLTQMQDIEQRQELQDYAPIAPNSRTYSLLIRHHARTAGDIDRVSELLREMGYNAVPLEGSIFIVIFHGFNNFGGVRYSLWTRDRLEQTWKEYLKAVEIGLERTFFSKMAVISALRAFKKCTDVERTMKAWDEVRQIWKPSVEEAEEVMKVLRALVPQDGFFDPQV